MKRHVLNLYGLLICLLSFYPYFTYAYPSKNDSDGLKDGYYIGLASSYDNFKLSSKVNFTSEVTIDNFDPTISVNGISAGGFVGYEKFFPRLLNTFLGLELFALSSSAHENYVIDFWDTDVAPGDPPDSIELLVVNLSVKSIFGINVRPGIKLNDKAILYLKLGYNWAVINVSEENADLTTDLTIFHESVTSVGSSYGIGMEVYLNPKFNMRFEFTQATYNSFTTKLGTSIKSSDSQFMAGLVYFI